MNRDEFMKELEYLLSDIPEEEKEDALNYYRDYLEEAGDQEEEAIREFGSPERIAAIIRSDLRGDLDEGGSFTERGYEDERFRDPNYQVAKRLDLPEEREGEEKGGAHHHGSFENGEAAQNGRPAKKAQKSGVGRTILLVVLLLIASPVLLGIGGGLLGLTLGLGGGILGLAVGVVAILFVVIVLLAVLTFTFLLAGVAVCIVGIIAMFSSGFLDGLLCLGGGLILLAFGLLGLVLSVWFYGKFLPWLIRVCVDGISRLFHRRRRVS